MLSGQSAVLSKRYSAVFLFFEINLRSTSVSRFLSLISCSATDQGAQVVDVTAVSIAKLERQRTYAPFYMTSLWYHPKRSNCSKNRNEKAENL